QAEDGIRDRNVTGVQTCALPIFLVFKDEKFARQIGEARQKRHLIASRGPQNKISLEDLFDQIKQGEIKDLNVIIKADVQGSAEALAASLQKIKVDTVQIKII